MFSIVVLETSYKCLMKCFTRNLIKVDFFPIYDVELSLLGTNEKGYFLELWVGITSFCLTWLMLILVGAFFLLTYIQKEAIIGDKL